MKQPEIYQNVGEFGQLVDIYRTKKPHFVLEIGSMYGGTLYHWMDNAEPGTRIVSVDLTVGPEDARHDGVVAAKKEWPEWAAEKQIHFVAIEGSSQDKNTIRLILECFPEGVDFAFIDGDHGYGSVMSDFTLCRGLMRSEGIIAFHDVDLDGWEVKRFWKDLLATTHHRTQEIVDKPGDRGIGIFYT